MSDTPPQERILIGASWYPEMWPEDQWPGDVAKMNELGFTLMRLFEFAWHKFEPAEGQYDFAWAHRCLDLLHKAGIQAMIGTPTAAPPAWLTAKYPDTLQTKADGRVASHGQRKHYSHYSARYRELCARIVSRMTDEFAGHPALHSWQIDNEMSGSDYGSETRAAFHAYLKDRFGTIENLNRAWGLEFWSQAYASFDQIPMPIASVGSIEVPERHHPSLIMAMATHRNNAWTDFIRNQCDIIRKKSDKPITTNMTSGMAMQWWQHNKVLDRVGFSMYRDVLHYHWNLQNFDRMRAEKDYLPYYLLETAPSWSAGGKMWNIHHDEKGIANISWTSILLGGSMILYWQWREHWAGQEMQHGTLVTATGKWRPNKDAIQKICADAAKQETWLAQHPPQRAEVAIMISAEASWFFSIDPIDDNMRYDERWRDDFYLPLARSHIWRDVIDPTHDLAQYKVLVVPMMPSIPADTRRRLAEWVRNGGHLLLGPLVGYRTEEHTAFTDREFGELEDLIGGESALRFTVHWMEDRVNVAFADGTASRTRNWCEAYAPTTGKVLARYEGGYGNGLPAVLENAVGKGVVITTGCKVSEEAYLHLVKQLMARAGVKAVASGSREVSVVPRARADGSVAGYGIINLAESDQEITLPAGGIDRLSGRKTQPTITLSALEVMLVEV